ncbi:general substrate transporter [Stachybotrys elegans]|uniref:General substrate transporter n=1 Tax=Stachybotrys elegans TaxID=80388 RepID=A0A8K0WTH7_9HYPO|nr:general substrate transporter [Stachybotrys elegans]
MGLKEKIGLGDQGSATLQARNEAPQFEHVTWYKDPGLRQLTVYAIVLCATSAGTGYDGDTFGDPTSGDLGLIGALYQIGAVCSIPMVPIIADRWGRKPCIGVGFIIMAIGSALQAAANDYGTFCAGRVLLGFGNSFSQICSPMLLTEICHPQHRARFTTVYNCLWNLGALVVNWTCFGTNYWGYNTWQWRFPAIIQGVPGLIQLCFLWHMPESPRFLIAKDRSEEALQILAKYHANGNTEHPTVQFEFREIHDTIKMEQAAQNTTKYIDFFKTKGNRFRLSILVALGFFSQWSGNAVISNYSSRLYRTLGMGDQAVIGINAGSTSMSMFVSIGFALLVDRVNRRFMFLLATGGMFISLAGWTLACALHEREQAEGADVGMIFVIWCHQFFYSTAWSGLLVGYAVEILPYSLRAKGLMILNISIQIALLLNTYLNPYAFDAWRAPDEPNGDPSRTGYGGQTWILYLIYTIWVGGELVFVYFMFVETRGPTLEELVKVIDGPDARVADIDGPMDKDLLEKDGAQDEVKRISSDKEV